MRTNLPSAVTIAERQHVVLHRAVAHRVGAGGAGRRHAADRGVGAGIDREEQAAVAQMRVERLAGDAGLDHAIEVLGVDGEHAVHAREIDANAAVQRIDVAFQRRAGAEADDRRVVPRRRSSPLRSTSSRLSANSTASGGALASQVKVWPCCSRTACEVTMRLPKCAASALVSSATLWRKACPRVGEWEVRHGSSRLTLWRGAFRAAHSASTVGHHAMGEVARLVLRAGVERSRDAPLSWYLRAKERTMASEWVRLTLQTGEEIHVNLANASMHRDENLTCIRFQAGTGEGGKIRVTETIEQILAAQTRLSVANPRR